MDAVIDNLDLFWSGYLRLRLPICLFGAGAVSLALGTILVALRVGPDLGPRCDWSTSPPCGNTPMIRNLPAHRRAQIGMTFGLLEIEIGRSTSTLLRPSSR